MTADPIEWIDTVATFAELPATPGTWAPSAMPPPLDIVLQPEDDTWIERCRARILALDRDLMPEHATLFARFMSRRPGWRDEPPETVAERVIRPLRPVAATSGSA